MNESGSRGAFWEDSEQQEISKEYWETNAVVLLVSAESPLEWLLLLILYCVIVHCWPEALNLNTVTDVTCRLSVSV